MNKKIIAITSENADRARDEYVAGLSEIKQKREHVIACVKSLLRLISENDQKEMRQSCEEDGSELEIRLKEDRCEWTVTDGIFGWRRHKRYVQLTCGSDDGRTMYNTFKPNHIDLADISQVFDSIGVLICGISEIYPALKEKTKPIL